MTYVLNTNWQLIKKMPTKQAIKKVFNERAKFLDPDSGETFDFDGWAKRGWKENFIICSNTKIERPDFIVLTHYNGQGCNTNNREARFSRYNIYVRDGGRCMFCGKHLPFAKGAFTFDHLHPKSKGGPKDWLNIVLSCHQCNRKKGNKSLEESGLKLREKPIKPTPEYLRARGLKIRNEIWKEQDPRLSRFI